MAIRREDAPMGRYYCNSAFGCGRTFTAPGPFVSSCPHCGGNHIERLRDPDDKLTLIRVGENDEITITAPKNGATGEEAVRYVLTVRNELWQVLRQLPRADLYRIDLDNGERGGYFADESTAVTTLLYEAVDAAREAKGKPLKPLDA